MKESLLPECVLFMALQELELLCWLKFEVAQSLVDSVSLDMSKVLKYLGANVYSINH